MLLGCSNFAAQKVCFGFSIVSSKLFKTNEKKIESDQKLNCQRSFYMLDELTREFFLVLNVGYHFGFVAGKCPFRKITDYFFQTLYPSEYLFPLWPMPPHSYVSYVWITKIIIKLGNTDGYKAPFSLQLIDVLLCLADISATTFMCK